MWVLSLSFSLSLSLSAGVTVTGSYSTKIMALVLAIKRLPEDEKVSTVT